MLCLAGGGGGRDGGDGGGGASGGAVALHEADVGILKARLAAAGPSPVQSFEKIEAMAAGQKEREARTRCYALEEQNLPRLVFSSTNINGNLSSMSMEDRVRLADGRQAEVDKVLLCLQSIARVLKVGHPYVWYQEYTSHMIIFFVLSSGT